MSDTQPLHGVEDKEDRRENTGAWGRVVFFDAATYGVVDLYKSEVTLGRHPDCDIAFKGILGISGIHCRIIRRGASTFIRDQSTNGTWVQGRRITKEEVPLHVGDKISLYKSPTEKISFFLQDCAVDTRHQRYGEGHPLRYYHIGAVLGTGGFATVKKVVSKTTGKAFAMKVINKRKVAFALPSSERVTSLKDEINILTLLEHPHIVKMQEAFETEMEVFVILELVSGGELFDLVIERGKLSEVVTRSIFKQVMGAVKYLHAVGVVHRDLKPENILLHPRKDASQSMADCPCCKDDDGEFIAKITDFGLSRTVHGTDNMQSLAGTLCYIAPEILTRSSKSKDAVERSSHLVGEGQSDEKEGQGYGKECDIWSMGVVLYVMLSGTAPFDTSNQALTHKNVVGGRYHFEDAHWNDVSPEAINLIQQMLVIEPENRIDVEGVLKHPWILGQVRPQSPMAGPEKVRPSSAPESSRPRRLSSDLPVVPEQEQKDKKKTDNKEKSSQKKKRAAIVPDPGSVAMNTRKRSKKKSRK